MTEILQYMFLRLVTASHNNSHNKKGFAYNCTIMYGITPYGRIFGGELNLADWQLDKQTAK